MSISANDISSFVSANIPRLYAAPSVGVNEMCLATRTIISENDRSDD